VNTITFWASPEVARLRAEAATLSADADDRAEIRAVREELAGHLPTAELAAENNALKTVLDLEHPSTVPNQPDLSPASRAETRS
jgi:hypothetical protein